MNPTPQKLPTQVPVPGMVPRRRPERRRKQDERPEVALRTNPDGIVETIPLTLDILLNPSLDVRIPQSDEHFQELHTLSGRLKRFVERQEGWRLFSDVIIDWPGLRNVSPDISIAENVPREPPGGGARMSLVVGKRAAGCGLPSRSCRVGSSKGRETRS